jgi:hypothetical protein
VEKRIISFLSKAIGTRDLVPAILFPNFLSNTMSTDWFQSCSFCWGSLKSQMPGDSTLWAHYGLFKLASVTFLTLHKVYRPCSSAGPVDVSGEFLYVFVHILEPPLGARLDRLQNSALCVVRIRARPRGTWMYLDCNSSSKTV